MAAPAVHVATGKCGICGMQFEKHHFNITVTKPRVEGWKMHEKVKACRKCANDYFSRGE